MIPTSTALFLDLDFSLLQIYLWMVVHNWHISLLIGVLLAGVAIFATSKWLLWRVLSGVGAAMLLVPLLLFANNALERKMALQRYQQKVETHSWMLKKPRTIAGINLPADTKIYFNTWFDMQSKAQATLDDINSFELSAPTEINEMVLNGRFYGFSNGWIGTLVGNQSVEGWPCTGEVKLDFNLKLDKCTFYKEHTVAGKTFPKGTKIDIEINPFKSTWYFHPPDDKYLVYDIDKGKFISQLW